jgi:hypothetical protein
MDFPWQKKLKWNENLQHQHTSLDYGMKTFEHMYQIGLGMRFCFFFHTWQVLALGTYYKVSYQSDMGI